MLRVLLLLALSVPALRAFPDGAPAEACIRGMEPNHSTIKGRSHADSPFAVLRHTSHGQVTVTIKQIRNSAIKGFMIQARDPLTGAAARHQGVWLPIKNVKGLPECAAVTHADRGEKAEVSVTWEGRTDLAFYATVVSSYSSFWVEIEAVEQGGFSGPSGPGPHPSGPSGPGAHLSGFSGPRPHPSGFSGPRPHQSGFSGPSGPAAHPNGFSGLGGVPPSGLSALSSGPSGNSFHPFAGKKK